MPRLGVSLISKYFRYSFSCSGTRCPGCSRQASCSRVVEWKTRLLEQYGKIDLWQMISVLVFTVLDLTESLRITGDRCRVVRSIFILGSAFALKAEELHLLFFSDAPEQFTGPLRGDIFTVRMPVELAPLAEPVQGVLIFEDQIICY